MQRFKIAILVTAAGVWGCQPGTRDDDNPSGGITTSPGGGGGSGSDSSGDGDGTDPGSGGSGATGDGSGDTDDPGGGGGPDAGGGIKLDVGSGGSGGGEGPRGAGCQKVDFLFVVDSSGSMGDEQSNLLASFPGFISAIRDTLMIEDFHVMAVEAGDRDGPGCDGTLGAGRLTDAAGNGCGLVGGHRYATQDQPDLVSAFTCMASVGIGGSIDEKTMDATIASVTALEGPGQCNEGFLRDDAILVITIISDEEDDPTDGVAPGITVTGQCDGADYDGNSSGDPGSWHDAVVAAKNQDPGAVVVLSLVGDCDTTGTCEPIRDGGLIGAEPAPRIRAFANSFGYGQVGPVCAPDYSPFFAEAIGVIDTACDDFVPPG